MGGRADGRTDGRTDGRLVARTGGRADGRVWTGPEEKGVGNNTEDGKGNHIGAGGIYRGKKQTKV